MDKSKSAIKSGFLSKKGGDKGWNKRWFELRPQNLSYYNSKRAKVRGDISLLYSIIEPSNESKTSFIIKYSNASRKYLLSATNEEEMNSWMNAIKICISNLEPEAKSDGKVTPKSKHSSKVKRKKSEVEEVTKIKFNSQLPSQSELNSLSKDQLIEFITSLQEENENKLQEITTLKQKSYQVVNSLKSHVVNIHNQNKQIQKEILLKDANIRKVQLKIVEANQRVVDSIPFQDTGMGLSFELLFIKIIFYKC